MRDTIITLLCFILLILTACDSSNSLKPEETGKMEIRLSQDPLSSAGTPDQSTPFILQEDIESYEWATHTITLTPTGVAKIPQNLELFSQKKFVISINGETIYTGFFVNALSSGIWEGPVIVLPSMTNQFEPLNENQIRIDKGYPPHLTEVDLRNDQRIYNALKAHNLLK